MSDSCARCGKTLRPEETKRSKGARYCDVCASEVTEDVEAAGVDGPPGDGEVQTDEEELLGEGDDVDTDQFEAQQKE